MSSNKVPEGQIVEAGLLSTEEKEYNISFIDLHSNHDPARDVFHCAKLLRSYIKESTLEEMKFPPSPEDVNEEAAPIPDMLYNLLGCLLFQSDECKELNKGKITTLSERMHHKMVSVAQNIVFIASNGSKQTPKHTALPMTMMSITGSSEVVILLNWFGHGVSYSKLEKIETAMAKRQINKHENEDLIPSNCQKNIFLTFVYDNNDMFEETLSGIGTTHCTNGIVIQRSIDRCAEKPDGKEVNFSKKRTLEDLHIQILPYCAKKKSYPEAIPLTKATVKGSSDEIGNSKKNDFLWLICRLNISDSYFISFKKLRVFRAGQVLVLFFVNQVFQEKV